MLKKTVTYEDPFTQMDVTEDLYFNLTKAELVEMEMTAGKDGLKAHLEAIAASENGEDIMREMKGIIFKAYGKKTDNGRFIKNDQVREEFEASEAFSALFMKMVTDADAAVEFVAGIMPKDMVADNQEQLDVDRPNLAKLPPRTLTRAEMVEMDGAELRSGLAEGRYVLSKE